MSACAATSAMRDESAAAQSVHPSFVQLHFVLVETRASWLWENEAAECEYSQQARVKKIAR